MGQKLGGANRQKISWAVDDPITLRQFQSPLRIPKPKKNVGKIEVYTPHYKEGNRDNREYKKSREQEEN